MTKNYLLIPVLVALISCATKEDASSINTTKVDTTEVTVPEKDWELVWSDEFDYEGLPDNSRWDYEMGFVRNEESQYYTRKREANAVVHDGFLTITGLKEKFPNAAYRPGSTNWRNKDSLASYTSASIITKGKASWTYGKIEVRAKLPRGNGVWPAIWTLGTNIDKVGWPECGEIDIMEYVGYLPDTIHGTLHYKNPSTQNHDSQGGECEVQSPWSDFHTYSVLWDSVQIKIYVDDKLNNTFNVSKAGSGTDNGFRKPHYLILNLALGGEWGGTIDDSILPQEYIIDYVRVYKLK